MRLVAVLVSLALVTATCPISLANVSEPKDAVPSEILAGTAGGAVLGFGAGYLLSAICLSQTSGLDAIGCIAPLILGYIVGVPTGAIAGVNIAGSRSGVQGNVLLSILGGVGGGAIGMLVATSLMSAIEENSSEVVGLIIFLGIAPLIASLGATWGFNAGATLADGDPTAAGQSPSPEVLAMARALVLP